MKKILLYTSVAIGLFWIVGTIPLIAFATYEHSPKPTPTPNRYVCETPAPKPTSTPVASPTPQVTPVATATPVPTATPTDTPVTTTTVIVQAPRATPVPTVAPTPQPPTEERKDEHPPVSAPPVCVATEIKHAPTVINVKRIDSDSIWIQWSPVDEHIKNYIVEYSLGQNFKMWNTKVINSREVTINDLPKNRHIWVRVAGTDNCVVGRFGLEIDP